MLIGESRTMPRKSEPSLVNNVRDLRANEGMTQQELATRVGVTRQTIVALERGAYTPSLVLAIRIGRVFNKTVEKVFQLDE